MENLLKKIKALSLLARIDKPIGTLLLLWPTLSSFCLLTYGNPSLNLILIFILGTFLMRSAGCIINDIFDREFDKEVLRTKTRPLVTKEITVKEALFVNKPVITSDVVDRPEGVELFDINDFNTLKVLLENLDFNKSESTVESAFPSLLKIYQSNL